MNEQKLIQNVIEQIKEAQLKLGAEKEVIRLYFPMASMNAILGTHYTDEQEMLTALRTNTVFDTTVLGRLKFFIHEGRFEVRVPAVSSSLSICKSISMILLLVCLGVSL